MTLRRTGTDLMDLDALLPPRLRSHDAAWWATAAHWLGLGVAFVFLLWINRHQWFNVDEWNFLVDRSLSPGGDDLGYLAPHNEHWSTIPVIGYRILFAIFGVRTYLPYLVVLIVVHLVVAHLLWRLLRRVGVDAWLATAAIALFTVLGIGWENLTSAFQWQLIGPLATGLGALLLTPERGPLQRRDLFVVVLMTLGLMFSGLGVTMVLVVAITIVLRRGVRIAVVNVAVPAFAYLAWYAAYGRDAGKAPLQKPFTTAVQDVPAFVWRGLTGAVDGATGLESIGAVVLALLVLWLLLRRGSWPGVLSPLVLAMAAGAVAFLALTTLRRSGFGIDVAASSRYAYIVVALLLPAVALAIDAVLRGSPLRWAALLLGGAALLLVQVSLLARNANEWGVQEQAQKHLIVASAQLTRAGETVIYPVPVPTFIPNLSVDEIAELDRDGDLPRGIVLSRRDVLSARAAIQSNLGPDAVVTPVGAPEILSVRGATRRSAATADCARFETPSRATIDLRLRGDAALDLLSPTGGEIGIAFRDGTVTGRTRRVELPPGRLAVLSIVGGTPESRLTLPAGSTEICGLAPE